MLQFDPLTWSVLRIHPTVEVAAAYNNVLAGDIVEAATNRMILPNFGMVGWQDTEVLGRWKLITEQGLHVLPPFNKWSIEKVRAAALPPGACACACVFAWSATRQGCNSVA